MKTSTQLKAHLRNLSKKSQVEAEILLRNFMFERLLERISLSNYKHNFILKGGMLIAAMVGVDARTTMDMDTTIKGRTLTAPEIDAIVGEILRVPIDDGVEFNLCGIEEIRVEANYPGYRVSIKAFLDGIRQHLKIDITTGDFVTPEEISLKLMLEDRTIRIMANNLETVLAEKFETVITRGITNTRMRDFYDLHILTTTKNFNYDKFKAALNQTIENRGTARQMSDTSNVIAMVAGSPVMLDLWRKYSEKYHYAAEVTWNMVIDAVKGLNEVLEGKNELTETEK